MIDPIYVTILRKLYARLHGTAINWVVTGSLSFAMQGIAVEPHDIDLQTDEAGAYAIEHLFSEFVIRKVTFSSTEKIRSHFGALHIDGVKVEIMGDIQKRLEDGTWEHPVELGRYKQCVEFEGMQVPMLSLEYEYQAYLKLGRFERAQMLREHRPEELVRTFFTWRDELRL
jgi:hypothetical protein